MNAFLSAHEARKLPLNTPERQIAEYALRQWWHYLYDYCPTLLTLFPPDGKSLLEEFLEMHFRGDSAIGWWSFLMLFDHPIVKSNLSEDLKAEILSAAVSRWLAADLSQAQSVCLIERRYGICVMGLKAESLTSNKQVVMIRHSYLEDQDAIFLSTSAAREFKSHAEWIEIWSPEET